jgi:hypothetical protein
MSEDLNKIKTLGVAVLIALQIVSISLYGYQLYRESMTRRMLNARARIQITLIESGERRGVFTLEERQKIGELWEDAEYGLVKENPFKK